MDTWIGDANELMPIIENLNNPKLSPRDAIKRAKKLFLNKFSALQFLVVLRTSKLEERVKKIMIATYTLTNFKQERPLH